MDLIKQCGQKGVVLTKHWLMHMHMRAQPVILEKGTRGTPPLSFAQFYSLSPLPFIQFYMPSLLHR